MMNLATKGQINPFNGVLDVANDRMSLRKRCESMRNACQSFIADSQS
jgi:hypothetical protein